MVLPDVALLVECLPHQSRPHQAVSLHTHRYCHRCMLSRPMKLYRRYLLLLHCMNRMAQDPTGPKRWW